MSPDLWNDSLSEDEIFDLLSSARRRRVLRRLVDEGGPVGLQRLAEEVAAGENEKTVDQLTAQEQKRVYVSLYQTHVPAMTDAGVVDYEPDSGLILPTERVSQLKHYLKPDSARPDPRPHLLRYEIPGERDVWWRLTNAGLALVGLVVLLVVAVTLSPFDPTTKVVVVGLLAVGAGTFSLLAARVGTYHEKLPSPPNRSVWVLDDGEWMEEARYGRHPPDATDGDGRRRVCSLSVGGAPENRVSDRKER